MIFMQIVMATRNRGKAAELQQLLGDLAVDFLTLDSFSEIPEIEETGQTFRENAVLKAQTVAHYTLLPTLADDSGLSVDALGGQPGVYSARFAGEPYSDEKNNRKLLALLKGVPLQQRTARFVSALAFITADGLLKVSEGYCEGFILEEPRGSGGFGYDPLFYLPSFGKTMAELSPTEKNQISHRGKALREMLPFLRQYLETAARAR
ncbi:MAG: XTP/dITP diphosphatase [Peptococcia bacterium]|jgi:XTP/dITP diphosphohydrolase